MMRIQQFEQCQHPVVWPSFRRQVRLIRAQVVLYRLFPLLKHTHRPMNTKESTNYGKLKYQIDQSALRRNHPPSSLSSRHARFSQPPGLCLSRRARRPRTSSADIPTLARLHTRQVFLTALVFLCCLLYFVLQRQPLSSVNDIGKFKTRFQLTPSTRNATMSAGISAIRIPAKANATASIIWLHGLGDSGRGWSFISQYYNISVSPRCFVWGSLMVACQGAAAVQGRC